jgi:hypothetical protein
MPNVECCPADEQIVIADLTGTWTMAEICICYPFLNMQCILIFWDVYLFMLHIQTVMLFNRSLLSEGHARQ